MPRYKDSPEVRAAKQERREKLRQLLALMEVEDVRDLKSVFKEMVGEVLENGLEADLDDKLGYTTNSIENFNRQLRKVSKNRPVFPNDDSLLKMLYLAQVDITRKWTGRRRDWGETHSQLEIFFADRLPE